MTTAKYWCFTENSDPRSFLGTLPLLQANNPGIKYICGQLEQGTHLHVQGYVQLSRSQRLSWVRNNISDTAHWERQRGTNQEARDYCCKTDGTEIADSFIESGTFIAGRANQGARNDIHSLRDRIKGGASQRALIEDDELVETFAKFIKFADRCRSLYPPPRREEPLEVQLFVGPPGSGKTHKAFTDYPQLFEIPITNGTLWLDGYDDHETVLFDDFMGAGSKLTLDNTLKFFDKYVRQVPIKGTHVWYRPKVIVVTSNYHPRHWYKWLNREVSYEALARRFTKVLCFSSDRTFVEEVPEEYFMDRELWPEENWQDQ